MKPNFKNYTITQLHESLSSVDKEKYPENVNEIKNEINARKEAGFVFFGESRDTTSNQHELSLLKVALPVWWRYTWRSTIVLIILSILISLPIGFILGVIGIPEYMPYIVTPVQFILVPIIGMYFMRQAIVGKYKNFFIEITIKPANK